MVIQLFLLVFFQTLLLSYTTALITLLLTTNILGISSTIQLFGVSVEGVTAPSRKGRGQPFYPA